MKYSKLLLLAFFICGCGNKSINKINGYCYEGHILKDGKCNYTYTTTDTCESGDIKIIDTCYSEYEPINDLERSISYTIDEEDKKLEQEEMYELFDGIKKYLKENGKGEGVFLLSDIVSHGYLDNSYLYCDGNVYNFKDKLSLIYICDIENDNSKYGKGKKNINLNIKGNLSLEEKGLLINGLYNYMNGYGSNKTTVEVAILAGYIPDNYSSCNGEMIKDKDKYIVNLEC